MGRTRPKGPLRDDEPLRGSRGTSVAGVEPEDSRSIPLGISVKWCPGPLSVSGGSHGSGGVTLRSVSRYWTPHPPGPCKNLDPKPQT